MDCNNLCCIFGIFEENTAIHGAELKFVLVWSLYSLIHKTYGETSFSTTEQFCRTALCIFLCKYILSDLIILPENNYVSAVPIVFLLTEKAVGCAWGEHLSEDFLCHNVVFLYFQQVAFRFKSI